MASLFHDGDLRVIYEVPTDPTFTVDGGGYRIYTPASAPEDEVRFTTTDLWSRFVDYRAIEEWSTVAYSRQGGAFRFQDELGNDVFATFDLRCINDWLFVPANYPHKVVIAGNFFPNLTGPNAGSEFDTSRLTVQGVIPVIERADSLQVIRENITSAGGSLTPAQEAMLNELWRMRGLDPANPVTVTPLEESAGDITLDVGGDGTTSHTLTRRP